MNTTSSRFVLCADVQEINDAAASFEQTFSARLLERRITRLERSAKLYQGRVLRHSQNTLFASFDSADLAVLCACEMQRRNAELLPIAGLRHVLRIGIHYGPAKQRAADEIGPTEVLVSKLTATLAYGGIVLSELVADILQARLREELRAQENALPELPAQLFDWQHSIHLLKENSALQLPANVNAKLFTPHLVVRHAQREYFFGEKHPVVTFGRGFGNDIFIGDVDASRKHCQLLRREKGYLLVDTSSKGTFVTPDNAAPFTLQQGSISLAGSGFLSFGKAYDAENNQVAEYEVLGN